MTWRSRYVQLSHTTCGRFTAPQCGNPSGAAPPNASSRRGDCGSWPVGSCAWVQPSVAFPSQLRSSSEATPGQRVGRRRIRLGEDIGSQAADRSSRTSVRAAARGGRRRARAARGRSRAPRAGTCRPRRARLERLAHRRGQGVLQVGQAHAAGAPPHRSDRPPHDHPVGDPLEHQIEDHRLVVGTRAADPASESSGASRCTPRREARWVSRSATSMRSAGLSAVIVARAGEEQLGPASPHRDVEAETGYQSALISRICQTGRNAPNGRPGRRTSLPAPPRPRSSPPTPPSRARARRAQDRPRAR